MGRRVLIVEDQLRIREVISDYFLQDGWEVKEASNGQEALDLIDLIYPDLIILDIMMPEVDGFQVCREVRKHLGVPIIFLTAKSDDEDKLLGYELGADDYLTKPFSPKVLVAKANSLMKRVTENYKPEGHRYTFGSAVLNTLARRLEVDRIEVELTHKEYELLLFLINNKNLVVTRDAIISRVWGLEFNGDNRVVDSHIKKLRAKLGHSSHHIRTVVGIGYKFSEEEV
ncbi:response regulator transcription factor [Paenibacillus sp. HN-1]|uniref:response regulator transcription factor n=1 Tax=Paenibacillus TaxID=44249 RepID=UPI001CA9B0C4|nr:MULTISPECIES: response regulator transcription factor [Paenibacillus]MBY9079352.1 response regulator transcription factor [Paenibacillus sp. CGMCC 1.18879]MBY9086461.1 response regulator transcription factor [Paenibacillus sinensis]